MSVRVAEHWVDHQAKARRAPEPEGWRRSFFSIAEVLFAQEGEPPPPQRLRWLCEKTRLFAEDVGGRGIFAFRAGVFLAEWVAPVLVGQLPPLRQLDFHTRVEALERMERSPLGLALFAVKGVACINYFEHPDTARAVGFDGGCGEEAS